MVELEKLLLRLETCLQYNPTAVLEVENKIRDQYYKLLPIDQEKALIKHKEIKKILNKK